MCWLKEPWKCRCRDSCWVWTCCFWWVISIRYVYTKKEGRYMGTVITIYGGPWLHTLPGFKSTNYEATGLKRRRRRLVIIHVRNVFTIGNYCNGRFFVPRHWAAALLFKNSSLESKYLHRGIQKLFHFYKKNSFDFFTSPIFLTFAFPNQKSTRTGSISTSAAITRFSPDR